MLRIRVAPGDVGNEPAADRRGEVRRLALVGAPGPGGAGHQLGRHVRPRQVVAGRQHGLEQQDRPGADRQHLAVQLQPDLAGAGQHVDAVERVARVGHVQLVLLVPGVEGAEVEDHQPGQVRVGRAEAGPGPHLPGRVQVDRLALGAVHGERNPRVEHPQRGHVGQGHPDVVAGTGRGRGRPAPARRARPRPAPRTTARSAAAPRPARPGCCPRPCRRPARPGSVSPSARAAARRSRWPSARAPDYSCRASPSIIASMMSGGARCASFPFAAAKLASPRPDRTTSSICS